MSAGDVAVFYDGDCEFCLRVVKFFRAVDIRGALIWKNMRDEAVRNEFSDLDVIRAEKELLVRSSDGAWYGGFDAVRFMVRKLLLLKWIWPFLFFPGIPYLGRKLYFWIADHRPEISRFMLG